VATTEGVRPAAHRRLRLPVLGALVAVLALPSASVAAGGEPTADQLDAAGVHEIIVKRAPGAGAGAQMRASADVTFASAMRLDDTEVVRARPGRLGAALSVLRADPDVVYAEPNAPVEAATADTYWRDQWGLENTGQLIAGGAYRGAADADIDAPQAWALAGTKGAGQTVAVVDSGVNAAHPDLSGQIAAGGADWVDGDGVPNDANGHGSHVAGIVAGRQDTTGITGVAPGAKVLALRVLDANGRGTAAQVANAFDYAGDMGVAIVNASLSSPASSQAEMDAIRQHPDTLFVLAAGNGGTDGVGDDNDVTPTWPCAAPQANVICVGASDNHDRRARFSNFGATSVDLFAPGVDILSAFRAPEFGWYYMDGTSMAAPEVAGTLALMRATAPALTAADLKQALLSTVDRKPQLVGRAVSGGRLNAATAVRAAMAAAGLAVPRADTDDDGVPDDVDNCPSFANPGQLDVDHDGRGDACAQTAWGPDTDVDGVPDNEDDCPAVADAAQADADGDGLGDACDPTPNGVSGTVAAAASAPVAPVVRTAPALPPGAPVLGRLATASGTRVVRICRPQSRGCAAASMTVVYRVDRAADVTIAVQRRACAGLRCRYATTTTLRAHARPGANRVTIGARGATARLRAGVYRLRIVAAKASARSATRTLSFRVR
jgi:subtilisin family serine protease